MLFRSNTLSIAQENIEKYCNIKNFNVERIKPEFSPIIPILDDSDSPDSSSSPYTGFGDIGDLSHPIENSKCQVFSYNT